MPRFFLLTGSGLGGCRRIPSSFRPVFLVPCVSYCVLAFRHRLIRRVRLARRSLPARPCLGDSGAVLCHPIGEVPCFAPSASAFRLSSPMRLVLSFSALLVPCLASPCPAVPRPDCRSAYFARLGLVAVLPLVRLSCCLASFRPSPRLACRRAGRWLRRLRLAVPWFPIVSDGLLLGVPFLGVARSSMAGRLASCPSPVVLACFPVSARALSACRLVPSCCLPRYDYRPAHTI